jgi:DNA polymerase V
MGDIARCSIGNPNEFYNEDLLYKMFGVNAELLIDHAWGWEPCTIADIKAYKPSTNSISSGQVLHCPYEFEKARLITREMTDLLVLDLVDKRLVTDQILLTVGYDIENLTNAEISKRYRGPVTVDHYGRKVPKHAHGTVNLPYPNSSTMLITEAVMELYNRIVNPDLLVRRITLAANHVIDERQISSETSYDQMDLFSDTEDQRRQQEERDALLAREKRRQQAVIGIKKKYGKNAIIKGMNLQEGATAMDRNRQIGGHKA